MGSEDRREPVAEDERTIATEEQFRRAFATVLRRYAPAFEALAEHDKQTARGQTPVD
ncbi:MAG TPA: hypothetical protein VGL81_30850 [Polyangiaceae bacterium]|jgi:hypothetical protein